MEFLRENQLNIMLALAFGCGLLSLFSFIQFSTSKVRKNALLCMSLSAMFLLLADREAYIFRGNTTEYGFAMTRVSNFVVFLMTLLVILSLNWYIIDYFDKEAHLKFKRLDLNNIICYIAIIMIIISQFTNWYYYFDEQNIYHRGSGFVLCYLFPLVILVIQLIVLIQNRHCFRKRILYPILFFTIVPIIASIAQVFLYGFSLTNISIVGLVILLRIFAVHDSNQEIVEAHKKEIHLLNEKNENAKAFIVQTSEALVSAIDAKDKYTNGHSNRVAEYSKKIAKIAGKTEEECEIVYLTALLHDVGKIGVPRSVLAKPGRLTGEEFESIKQHPVIGGNILSSIKESPWLSIGARYHHERYNGRGYPDGLKGEEIPEIARIIAVADAYDAMTSNRSYRNAIPQHIVREELVKGIGTQFDPDFARIMIQLIDLDTEYKMKESISGAKASAMKVIRCDSIYNSCSDGIGVTKNKATIRFCSQPYNDVEEMKCLPTLILYDSLDGEVHPGEENNKDLRYFEYAKIRLDGLVEDLGIRKSQVIFSDQETDIEHSLLSEPLQEQRYKIETVRNRDHVLVHVSTEKQVYDVILALPDTSRYVFVSISGENCEIHNIMVETDVDDAESRSIPRIADEISYIKNCPEGDISNIEIDGPRFISTKGILIRDEMTLKFHTMSYPTARLVWHCPYFCIFSSSNGWVDGEEYKEFLLLKIDGENWESHENVDNKVDVEQTESFEGWNKWMEQNKQGYDVEVIIKKEGNKIIMQTQNLGIAINSVTTIHDEVKDVYLSLTGDQCAITNIRIK